MTGKMGETMEKERKIREIFESGTDEQVKKLLEIEHDPEYDEDKRKLITKTRESMEAKGTFMASGVPVSTSGKTPRTPNLSSTEWNKD